MKVLLINGSPHEKGCTYTALCEVASKLHAEGVESEILWLGKGPVYGCTACLACRSNGGHCVFDDAANTIIDKMQQCDGMVIGSPVYFASANGALCAVMDRVFYAASASLAYKPCACI
ncbi:MAG: NAD(P)H-dependent oxidoreductase, partial [Oscillospiraceae bacterium]|nr:NAD(P)H-dependent oxidoreductase [Oscillospiraceae bacterium]